MHRYVCRQDFERQRGAANGGSKRVKSGVGVSSKSTESRYGDKTCEDESNVNYLTPDLPPLLPPRASVWMRVGVIRARESCAVSAIVKHPA